MIVFRVHCNFFIVLPIRLKACRSNGFFFFKRQNVHARKIGRMSEALRAGVLDRHRTRNLSRPYS